MTIIEKIIYSKVKKRVSKGDYIQIPVDWAMAHDGTIVLTRKYFDKINADKVWNNDKIFVVFDHIFPASNERAADLHNKAREFISEQGITKFYEGEGICHQILLESDYIKPGDFVIGADSHTDTIGAIGCFGIGVGATDMAYTFATGRTWIKNPETIRINLKGEPARHITAKDIFLEIARELSCKGAIYKGVVFKSDFVFPISWRATLCNMGIEIGAKTAIFEPDKLIQEYKDAPKDLAELQSDSDREFDKIVEINIERISPMVACPHSVDNVKFVKEVNEKIDVSFIGTCTGGRLDDLKIAADVLTGRKVKAGIRFLVCPASKRIYQEALKLGIIKSLVDSGAIILPPGCGPCLGLHLGVLGKGEVCISTANRNFLGRMGSKEALIFLASPLTVATSALSGEITSPEGIL